MKKAAQVAAVRLANLQRRLSVTILSLTSTFEEHGPDPQRPHCQQLRRLLRPPEQSGAGLSDHTAAHAKRVEQTLFLAAFQLVCLNVAQFHAYHDSYTERMITSINRRFRQGHFLRQFRTVHPWFRYGCD